MTSPAVFPGDVRVSDGENGSVDGGSDGGLVMHVTADVFRTRCADGNMQSQMKSALVVTF